MKKSLVALILIAAFLLIFVPLASSNPDGLEKVVQTHGVEEQKPIWEGFLKDYSVSFISDSYASTFLAGIVGTIIVILSALLLSRKLAPKKSSGANKKWSSENKI
jgi:hypothetical protein